MTEDSSSQGAKRRGDPIADTVILSSAKDLFTNNQILRNRGSERQECRLEPRKKARGRLHKLS